jgi:hypothetical protein
MRNIRSALCAMVAAGVLAGCAGSASPTNSALPDSAAAPQSQLINGHYVPHWSRFGNLVPKNLVPLGGLPLHGRPAPSGIRTDGSPVGGVYASQYDGNTVYCYPHNNMSNGAPVGSITVGNVEPQGIASDAAGNFIFPEGYANLARQIQVYQGPGLCGAEVGFFLDAYGQPDDASSADAVNGNIAVANMYDANGAGSISVCTLASGCGTNLTNANMYEVAGVTTDNNGNCWASGVNEKGTATLTYFKGCSGKGKAATGFVNPYFGGLDIDKNGNLVSISAFDAAVYIYHGCNPACTMVGGPFALQGQSLFGHLNNQSMTYSVADYQYGQIDVYQYSTTGLTYFYSFNNGLTAGDMVEGVAVAPRSRK